MEECLLHDGVELDAEWNQNKEELEGQKAQMGICSCWNGITSAKTDLASDPPALRPDASAGYSASHASCAS